MANRTDSSALRRFGCTRGRRVFLFFFLSLKDSPGLVALLNECAGCFLMLLFYSLVWDGRNNSVCGGRGEGTEEPPQNRLWWFQKGDPLAGLFTNARFPVTPPRPPSVKNGGGAGGGGLHTRTRPSCRPLDYGCWHASVGQSNRSSTAALFQVQLLEVVSQGPRGTCDVPSCAVQNPRTAARHGRMAPVAHIHAVSCVCAVEVFCWVPPCLYYCPKSL